jgi:hypothetical protein
VIIWLNTRIIVEIIYNLAIGSIVGHEIIHGFTELGPHTDEKGKNHTLWSQKTIDAYNNHSKCIIEQYNNYKVPWAFLFNVCILFLDKWQTNTWRKYFRQWWTKTSLLCMFYHHETRIENGVLLYRLIKNGFKLKIMLKRNFQVSRTIQPNKCFSSVLVNCGVPKWQIYTRKFWI